MEIAIEGIARGEAPPAAAVVAPIGAFQFHDPTSFRIPQGFPNPPPPAPLHGHHGVRLVLAQCGMNEDQITRFMVLGVSSLDDLAEAKESEVDRYIERLSRTPVARGGVIIGLGVASRVKAAASYLHELARMDGEIDAYNVSIPILRGWQLESRVIQEAGEDKITVQPPNTLDPKDWVSFKDGMVNYFRQTKGSRKIPLFYVIREDRRPETATNFVDSRIWSASLTGAEFDNDNAKVYQQLVQVLRGTDAWTYVDDSEGTQDGRGAWKRLCRHYDGPHAVEKRISLAEEELTTLFYKSEAAFPMERYVTRMSNCFRILAQNGAPKSTRDKVKLFLDNIQTTNVILTSYIAQIKTNFELKNNFELAADTLLEAVGSTAQLHERGATTNNRKVAGVNGKRNGNQTGGNSKKQRGGQGGKGPPKGTYTLEERNGSKFCNGVDVTDVKRTFSKEEYGKLGDYTQVIKSMREQRKVSGANSKKPSENGGNQKSSTGNGSKFGTGDE